MLPDFATRRGIALAGACCLILSACSPGANYPSLFPAIHDTPPPRSETPLDSVQVQQATEDLISARERLTAEAQSSQRQNSARPSANSATAVAAKKQPVTLSPANAAARRTSDSENAQDAGTETK
jgi:hypothetical protein